MPLHMTITEDLKLKRLRTTLSGACFASVELYDSQKVRPPPRKTPSLVVAALARSVATLTALHGLPLVKPHNDPDLGLAAFTRLRDLILHQTWDSPALLRATQLPTSLQELTLKLNLPIMVDAHLASMPRLVAFDRLTCLRKITVADFWSWDLSFREGRGRPLLLAPNLEVCTTVYKPALWLPLSWWTPPGCCCSFGAKLELANVTHLPSAGRS